MSMSDDGDIDVESDDVADVGDISGGALSPRVRRVKLSLTRPPPEYSN